MVDTKGCVPFPIVNTHLDYNHVLALVYPNALEILKWNILQVLA